MYVNIITLMKLDQIFSEIFLNESTKPKNKPICFFVVVKTVDGIPHLVCLNNENNEMSAGYLKLDVPLASGKFLWKILFFQKKKILIASKDKFPNFLIFLIFSEFSEANKFFSRNSEPRKNLEKKCSHLIFLRLNEIFEQKFVL
jgi:hypothetical protein